MRFEVLYSMHKYKGRVYVKGDIIETCIELDKIFGNKFKRLEPFAGSSISPPTKFTVITPTGDRPEAFELCKLYMNRQTIKPSQWIIVDDGFEKGDEAKEFSFSQYIRRERKKGEPKHTLPCQMLEAFNYVNTNYVLIMEDDDWYAPNYFEEMLKLFNNDAINIVGLGNNIYYNPIVKKYFIHENKNHSSWCSTGFSSKLIPFIEAICTFNTGPLIDLKIWRTVKEKNILLNSKNLCIGIKGLPGRAGFVAGHLNIKTNSYKTDGFRKDFSSVFFKECIGEDIHLYERFIK